jgi:hypothetical protein
MSFRTSLSDALHVVRTIRSSLKSSHLIYFDGDDDLCIQWPGILPYVDLYIKKHIFSDKFNYLKKYIGKSNLTDYVHHKYGYSFSARDYGNSQDGYTMISESGPVPVEQLGKIRLGFNLALDHNIVKLHEESQHRLARVTRQNDIIFRGSVTQENWSYHFRKDVEPILKRLGKAYKVITPNKRVTLEEYYQEMTSSKICVSPFGYGEICWRDFEAMLCGCLVIKPNMRHVETNPDIFKPFKTYVPVEWDFSDLEDKCIYYLTHEGERQRIVTDALKNPDEFYKNDGFIKYVFRMLCSLSN